MWDVWYGCTLIYAMAAAVFWGRRRTGTSKPAAESLATNQLSLPSRVLRVQEESAGRECRRRVQEEGAGGEYRIELVLAGLGSCNTVARRAGNVL